MKQTGGGKREGEQKRRILKRRERGKKETTKTVKQANAMMVFSPQKQKQGHANHMPKIKKEAEREKKRQARLKKTNKPVGSCKE